ncbi:hypothetical protein [Myxococcus sp. RHSTA-1-4]|uniref:hypothetical protein n=1 Tax=Myxococcus sp. RHSTA-1-4 TaxID=2874601 RepID=UPI001CBEB73C|nr:hypothetical protein [Myxococcus sp. RHSTA-1-4]MBZ4414891.1 hypothetical protein [Myxococcus sp. RHSTA-1-4]
MTTPLSAPPPSPQSPDYATVAIRFLDSLNSLRKCATSYLPLIAKIEGKRLAHIAKESDEIAELIKTESQEKTQEGIRKFKQIETDIRELQATSPLQILVRSLFLAVFSYFDAFTGDLLNALYHQKPELLDSIDKSITLREILRSRSINDIKEQAISRDIEQIRRDSYSEQFKTLESRFGIKTLREFKNWSKFIECSQRRNLFTHCDGITSDQYIQVCKREGYSFSTEPPIGERLELRRDYFMDAIDIVYEVGLKLGQTLWRQALPNQLEALDTFLIAQAYSLLQQERWKLAEVIGDFGLSQKKHSSDANRRILRINYAQAIKWSGDNTRAKDIINREDWSSCADDFQLCAAVLNDDIKKAVALMRKIGKSGAYVNQLNYSEWPIFRELRHTEEFKEAYRSIYNEALETTIQRTASTELLKMESSAPQLSTTISRDQNQSGDAATHSLSSAIAQTEHEIPKPSLE